MLAQRTHGVCLTTEPSGHCLAFSNPVSEVMVLFWLRYVHHKGVTKANPFSRGEAIKLHYVTWEGSKNFQTCFKTTWVISAPHDMSWLPYACSVSLRVVSPLQGGHLRLVHIASHSRRKRVEAVRPLEAWVQIGRCYFYNILSVKASHKATPDLGSRKMCYLLMREVERICGWL